MSPESSPENKPQRAPLKLRASVWRITLLCLALCVLQWRLNTASGLRHSLPVEVLGLFFVAFHVVRERILRPPVLRFWDDGSNYALRVRRASSGAVLYEIEERNLVQAESSESRFRGLSASRPAGARHRSSGRKPGRRQSEWRGSGGGRPTRRLAAWRAPAQHSLRGYGLPGSGSPWGQFSTP